MERVHVDLPMPGFDRPGSVIRYGHWGRPVLVFPSEAGRAWDYENNGMVGAVADLVDAGRIKLYCVDSIDERTWSDPWLSIEDRARSHRAYENWITDQVAGWIGEDSPGTDQAVVTGASMGAYHALQLGLRRPDLFPVSICLSGNYDPTSWRAWGEPGEDTYFANPTAWVGGLHGGQLDMVRHHAYPVLVVGQGAWETHPTGALPSTRHMSAVLADKGIPHELDLWGTDVAHDWPWWQRQIAHHLPRFC